MAPWKFPQVMPGTSRAQQQGNLLEQAPVPVPIHHKQPR